MSIIEDQRLPRELDDYEYEQAYSDADPAHGRCESCAEDVCLHANPCRNAQDGVTIGGDAYCLGICSCWALGEVLAWDGEQARGGGVMATASKDGMDNTVIIASDGWYFRSGDRKLGYWRTNWTADIERAARYTKAEAEALVPQLSHHGARCKEVA